MPWRSIGGQWRAVGGTWQGLASEPPLELDPDAAAYIAAVEAADGQALEPAIGAAIDTFVKGCKTDGIWTAIKASCILAGARTLPGALVPLKGPAPTNFNFVAEDYDRITGLRGDGSTKYLDTGRNASSDGRDDVHLAVMSHMVPLAAAGRYLGASETLEILNDSALESGGGLRARVNSGTLNTHARGGSFPAVIGISRAVNTEYDWVSGTASGTQPEASADSSSGEYAVFRRGLTGLEGFLLNGRLSFYSIGSAITLADLRSRALALQSAIAEALT